MTYWIYILASKPGGMLYVGVTNNLVQRVYEHREGLADGFTKRYGVKRLVYFEARETIAAALQEYQAYRAIGKSISSPPAIPAGGIYMKILSADADDGLPGQDRQRRPI